MRSASNESSNPRRPPEHRIIRLLRPGNRHASNNEWHPERVTALCFNERQGSQHIRAIWSGERGRVYISRPLEIVLRRHF